jgi:hypothetical protein
LTQALKLKDCAERFTWIFSNSNLKLFFIKKVLYESQLFLFKAIRFFDMDFILFRWTNAGAAT